MKINDFNKSIEGDLVQVSATVTWEDCDREEQRIYIETDKNFVNDLNCNTNAFLLAATIPAMRHGEHRIEVNGKVCPKLRNGLVTAMQILGQWYGSPPQGPVTIEATQGFEPLLPRSPQRTASFMSGGVDSLATLRTNRKDFPLDHPGSIQDGLFVHGFDIGGYENYDKNLENFKMSIASMSKMAEDAKLTLIPVYTNLRYLEGAESHPYSNRMFTLETHGAALAAIAHAFSGRITTALIASSDIMDRLVPWGSHPLLDVNYSSADVEIIHDGARFSRLEKVGLIAKWDAALNTLRACLDPLRTGDVMNCGKCEKCLRTMTQLLVYDKLKHCQTYPEDDVSPEMLMTLIAGIPSELPSDHEQQVKLAYRRLSTGIAYLWQHLVTPLRKIDRYDLADVIEKKLEEYKRFRKRVEEKDWKGRVKRLDRKYLGGKLVKLNQLIKGSSLNL
jgi:hypothetical protein